MRKPRTSAAARRRAELEQLKPGSLWKEGVPAFRVEEHKLLLSDPSSVWRIIGPDGEVAQLAQKKDADMLTLMLNRAHEEGIKAGRYLAALKRSEALKIGLGKAASEGRRGGRPFKMKSATGVVV